MKILIVEDQEQKSDDLAAFLRAHIGEHIEINIERSLRSGLSAICSDVSYELVILDMSMPSFDPSIEDPVGGTPESFAGDEFLAQMSLHKIETNVVVVTQYSIFSKSNVTLEELDRALKRKYKGFYHGAVYYSSASDEWKKTLSQKLMAMDL